MKSTLIEHLSRADPSAKARSHRGFALVVTLSLMILLTVIAVGLLTLSSISLRASSQGQAMAVAQANARLALMLAIGDLQKSAGPDQRITAAADILPAVEPATLGRAQWAGVWDTRTFNPAQPDTKVFVRWLVSDTPSAPADATAGADDVLVFTGTNDASSVWVPKIKVGANSNDSYAYWVADEGLKADLGWSEGEFTTAERQQAARLTAAPGPDHGNFAGPFSGKPNYPITKTADNPWIDNLDKALSAADMPLVMSDTSNQSTWLKSTAHGLTHGSRGILCDVKKGGLRRDLSLAFEMDGTAEAENASQFNQQAGEFVGNGDSLSAPRKPVGLPVNERFLWRDYAGMPANTGSPFAASIPSGTNTDYGQQRVLRGPNWWALRDYANLYKRLSGTDGDYTMQARAYFPNRSSERLAASDYHSHFTAPQTWDVETGINTSANNISFRSTINTRESATAVHYLYRPARANYAPVNLGTSVLVSMLARNVTGVAPNQQADLAVGLDPLFYFWNPYNRKIECENIAVVLGLGLPGRVVFDVTTTAGDSTSYDLNVAQLLKNNVTYGTGNKLIFLIKGPLNIEPGEVVIASPIASPTGGVGSGEAVLGYATDNNSGIIMTNLLPGGGGPLNVRLDDRVAFSFLRSATSAGSSGLEVRHEMDTNLPTEAGITPVSLAANMTLLGEQTQHNLQVLWGPTTTHQD